MPLSPQLPTLATLTSVRQLASLLQVDYGRELAFVLYRMPVAARYSSFEIAKKTGGKRVVHAPRPILKKLQQTLLPFLQELYLPPPSAHGHVRGRSIRTNAAEHAGRRFVGNVDIQEFFPSIHFKRVENILKSPRYGLNEEIARAIAQLACHEGRLPIGAPTSGILSNIVCAPLDAALLRHAKRYKLRYTRFVDDLTFSTSSPTAFSSGVGKPPFERLIHRDIADLRPELVEIISAAGFQLNPKKVWIVGPKARHSITGLVANKKVNVPIEFISGVRGTLHAIEAHGAKAASERYSEIKKPGWSPNFLNNITGRLAYIGQITNYSTRYIRLAQRARELIKSRSIYMPATDASQTVYHLTNVADKYEGTAFYIGGNLFVTAAHVFDVRSEMRYANLIRPHLGENKSITVECVAFDSDLDVALLRYNGASNIENNIQIRLTLRSTLPGDQVTAVGFPQYFDGNSHSEIVTRITGTRITFGVGRVEVDRPFPHGLSGAPVIDRHGYGIGVVHSGSVLGTEDAPLSTTFTPYFAFRSTLQDWVRIHKKP